MTRNETGGVTWFGVTVDKWLSILQTVGIPTVFMAVVCWLMWCYVPVLVQGHVKLLERTGDTLESMDKTLQQSNKILVEIGEVERESKVFMQRVMTDHDSQGKKLDVVIDQTKKP